MSVTNLEQLRLAREEAAHRTRRVILNSDGNGVVYSLKEATREALLAWRTTPLLGSQVDAIFYCSWSSGFGFFTHNTKVGQVFDTTANPKHPDNKDGGFSRNKTAEFIKQGTDTLQIMVECCKEHDIEIFWSCRMNDVHDAWGSWFGEYLFPQVKKNHPEWLVSSPEKPCTHGGWTAMDFNHPEVRDLAVRFFEEVCQNYDVDGIEMDFFRHPVYFKSCAWGKDATQQEADKMTDVVRQVRAVTEREGLQRGRPFLVAVRLPDSVGYCKAMGLDLVRWLEEGLVDILVVGGYFHLNDWEVSVKLGHTHGVPVYPSLDDSRIPDRRARKLRASAAGYRGRAANVWASGADGVYVYNAPGPRSRLWHQLGDPKILQRKDTLYTTGARGVAGLDAWPAWVTDGGKRFLKRALLSPERPRALIPGKAVRVDLLVGGAIPRKTAKGLVANVQLGLRAKGLPDPAQLVVQLNGKNLRSGAKPGVWIHYWVPPALVKQGVNKVVIGLKPGSKARPTLQDLALWVRHRRSSQGGRWKR